MCHFRSIVLSPLTIGAACLALGAAIALCGPSTPTTVAVVDLEVVYNKLDQHKASEAKLNAMVDGLGAELEKRQAELKLIQEVELASFTPGSPAHQEALAKAEGAIARYRAYEEFATKKTEAESERFIKDHEHFARPLIVFAGQYRFEQRIGRIKCSPGKMDPQLVANLNATLNY